MAKLTIERLIKIENPDRMHQKVLAFDPGETIGWSVFEGPNMVDCGQIKTKEFKRTQIKQLKDLFRIHQPDIMVFETYAVYSWKTDDHTWSEIHTAQIIGILRWFSMIYDVPYTKQTAQIAKGFCTDEKLKDWKLWQRGERHSRDSIRHAVYWLLFGKSENLMRP